MKKSWKQRWVEELNESIPELREDVKNAPIDVEQGVVQASEKPLSIGVWARIKIWFMAKKRRLVSCLATCAVCLLALAVVLPIALQGENVTPPVESGVPTTNSAPQQQPQEQQPQQPQAQLLSLEINPQVLFSANEEGKVVAVVAGNADADVVLSEGFDEELQGKPLALAVQSFVDRSAKLGYFNLNAPDAVRITACESETASVSLDEIKVGLQAYFQEKGAYAVVVDERLSLDGFCERYDLEGSTLEGVIDGVENLVSPYFERVSEGKTVEELQAEYRAVLPLEVLGKRFADFVQKNVDALERRVADVQAICALSNEIKEHRDNPSGVLDLDYWTLTAVQAQPEYTAEFAALLLEMEGLLTAYEANYGESIDNVGELALAWSACEILPIEELTAFLEGTTEQFIEQFDMVVQILEGISVDVSVFTCLYELPTTIAEYTEKLQRYIQTTYTQRVSEYSALYETSREAISVADYDAYVAGIIGEYGSLNSYWSVISQ